LVPNLFWFRSGGRKIPKSTIAVTVDHFNNCIYLTTDWSLTILLIRTHQLEESPHALVIELARIVEQILAGLLVAKYRDGRSDHLRRRVCINPAGGGNSAENAAASVGVAFRF